MGKKRQLVIVGCSVVETNGSKYYARSQIIEYLYGLREYYDHVTWMVPLAKSRYYSKEIDSSIINLNIRNPKHYSIYSPKGILEAIWHWWFFSNSINRNTDVLVFGISSFSLGYVLMVKFLGKNVFCYIGSDPTLSRRLRYNSLKGIIGTIGNMITFPICMLLADGIVARGRSIYAQCRKWNKNTHITKPIISYKHLKKVFLQKYSLKKENIVKFLYVGKLTQNKGVHILLDSFANITNNNLPKNTDTRLIYVGSGSLEHSLKNKIKLYNLESKVEFLGFIDEPEKLIEVYYHCDALVVPSIYTEGFPRTIDEAFACGLPVICSRIGGMKTDLNNNEVLFVKPGNKYSLSMAMKKLVEDYDMRQTMRNISRNRANVFLKATAAQQHCELMRSYII
ncbi:glycosyltransferase [Planctomycetota bacterium]